MLANLAVCRCQLFLRNKNLSRQKIFSFLTSKKNHITFKNAWSHRSKFGNSYSRNYSTQDKSSFLSKTRNIRNEEFKKDFKRMFMQAKPEKWKLTGSVCLLLFSSAVTMAVPFCIGKVIDVIYTSEIDKKKTHLQNICGIFIVIFALGALANFGRVYLIQTAGQRIIRNLRKEVFSSILKQEMTFFDRNKTGELINRLASDVTIIGQCLTQNVSDGLRALATVTACTSMMIYMSPNLTLVGMCTVPPVAAMAIIYGRYVRKITQSVQNKLAETTQVAEERIGNIRTVKAFAQEEREEHAYMRKLFEVLQLQYKEALAKAVFFGMVGLSGNLVVLSVLYYGGTMMADAQITVGELSAFILYAAYLGLSIGGMSSFYSELMRGVGASKKLWEIIDRMPTILSGSLNSIVLPLGNIQFKDVTFSYPTRPNTKIFNGLNLFVPAGSVTAFVGSSGSGKSTLAALLLRFYDPQAGAVLLDGKDVRHLDLRWLRSHIGIVSQEPVLFSTSIRENILYGAHNYASVSEEELMAAAKDANALEFIDKFPEKLETLVGERGTMLSGGQKQRIAISRALLKNPRILVLDEATSALDAESESLVQEALDRLMKGRTVITIAHRLSTIKHADNIAVFSGGSISEMGNYKTLMELDDGIFRKLVEKQTISLLGNKS